MDPAAYPRPPLDPGRPTGLLLCGMGGPDGPGAVEPFLRNLLGDPRVVLLPRPLAVLVGRLVARRRADAARRRYALMGVGGGSPQLDWTRWQGDRLRALLAERGLAVRPAPCMRYWHPRAREAVASVVAAGAEQVILLPLYPHFADATSGSSLDDALAAVHDVHPSLPAHVVPHWHRLPGYLEHQAAALADRLRSWARQGIAPGRCAAVLAAHALPRRLAERGDPYPAQVAATADAVRERLHDLASAEGWGDWLAALAGGGPRLAFQGRMGPVAWLEPDLAATVRELAADGADHLVVQPASFTCEHVETLVELDVELRDVALAAGIDAFARGPALNLDAVWLASLADHLAATVFSRREVAHA